MNHFHIKCGGADHLSREHGRGDLQGDRDGNKPEAAGSEYRHAHYAPK